MMNSTTPPVRTGPGVVIGYLSSGEVTYQFNVSLVRLTEYMVTQAVQHLDAPYLAGTTRSLSGPRVYDSRNRLLHEFLAMPDTPEWFFMVDDDMSFEPDVIHRLIAAAQQHDLKVVAGFAIGRAAGGYFPTLYRVGPGGMQRLEEWPDDGLLEVDATGSSCMLIHRDVIETVLAEIGGPAPWYQELPNGDHGMFGSDITFCLRVRQAGFRIAVHCGVEFGHVKPVVIDKRFLADWAKAHRVIVTGTGRCGTGYVSAVAQALGVPVGHEHTFHPAAADPPKWGALRGDSSWLAAPHLPYMDVGYVLHLVRHPVAVINSLVGAAAFSGAELSAPYRAYIDQHCDLVDGSAFEQACEFYVKWNQMIEPYADRRVRIEDVTPDDLVGLLNAAGSYPAASSIKQAMDLIPATYNHRPTDTAYTWADLPSDVQDLAKRYGYDS